MKILNQVYFQSFQRFQYLLEALLPVLDQGLIVSLFAIKALAEDWVLINRHLQLWTQPELAELGLSTEHREISTLLIQLYSRR